MDLGGKLEGWEGEGVGKTESLVVDVCAGVMKKGWVYKKLGGLGGDCCGRR